MGVELIDGNEAVVRGAIKAGCEFFAGYPITPASSILKEMYKYLSQRGGVVIECEDEIASINYCAGASMCGKKVMTATSGPGLSLYSETIGFAIMAELPIVIVVCQRMGPATGSATKTSSGDVQFVRWGTSGGYPIIALAPTSIEECYEMSVRAFNYAELFRCPVFLLLDKELSLTKNRTDLSKVTLPPVVTRKYDPQVTMPYFIKDENDIPPFIKLGEKVITRFNTSTHNQTGYLTTKKDEITFMMNHLVKKIESRIDEITDIEFEGDSELAIVSYGVTGRSVKEAIFLARKNGFSFKNIIVKTLWPVNKNKLKHLLKGSKKIFVCEMNHGQYFLEIERLGLQSEIKLISKVDGELMSPQYIINEIRRLGEYGIS